MSFSWLQHLLQCTGQLVVKVFSKRGLSLGSSYKVDGKIYTINGIYKCDSGEIAVILKEKN